MQDKAFVQIGKIVLEKMGNKEPHELFIGNKTSKNQLIILFIF